MEKDPRKPMWVIAGIVAVVAIIAVIITINRASFQRWMKGVQSEYNNGLERTVTVYDYNGQEIQSYRGKIDIEESSNGESGKVKFDLNGKRTIIYGGIVIVQEE